VRGCSTALRASGFHGWVTSEDSSTALALEERARANRADVRLVGTPR